MLTESLGMPNNFKVDIQTTDNRGQTPEEVAERCVNKLIGISNNAHPAIKEQAHAYRKEMEKIIAIYMRQAKEVIDEYTMGPIRKART